MDVLLFLAVGIVAGLVAHRLVPWTSPNAIHTSIAVGIVGASVGSFAGHLIGYRAGDPALFVTAAVSAISLAVAFGLLSDRRGVA